MKKISILVFFVAMMLPTLAEENNETRMDETPAQGHIDMENGVLGIADDRGFTLQSKDGRFVFKPYLFLQTRGQLNYYDDEGLDKAYNQDNVANSGFAIPYAILGFTGKTFGKLDYNLSINAAAKGANILQQAWIDYSLSPAARFRAGKFKTPFTHAYLTTLGETLFPVLPTSLTATSIMPHTLNAVTPQIGTGFDLGVEFHGTARLNKKQNSWLAGYEVGLWNGSGADMNVASKTFSDDWHIPSLLYAGRLTFMPWGQMPPTQGNSRMLRGKHILFGVSGGLNVESESESTNDARLGAEFSMLYNRWYVGAEAYWMHVGFTKRQKIDEKFNYWGAYAQVGYFVVPTVQLGIRYDFMDRNSSSKDGFLNMPAVVCNYYIPKVHLKLSAMYQFTGRYGHETQLDRDNDDLGISTHHASLQLQFSF
ncbi:MAG: porin [Bacteroidaceae bacterium]|nr:porin [Bacteroidaceae bacterium]MBQ9560635.1 porin [Bacteroidaceae bacterium]MBR1790118.1 porin [Bacteroidaceae bacterium]